jgi:hypothetical protein
MINEVKVASEEIHHFAFLRGFGSKQIEYKYFYNELKNNSTRDLYINNCGLLSCREIQKIKCLYNYNFHSFIIHVNQPFEYCPYINNIYNITDNTQNKENLICKLLYK